MTTACSLDIVMMKHHVNYLQSSIPSENPEHIKNLVVMTILVSLENHTLLNIIMDNIKIHMNIKTCPFQRPPQPHHFHAFLEVFKEKRLGNSERQTKIKLKILYRGKLFMNIKTNRCQITIFKYINTAKL